MGIRAVSFSIMFLLCARPSYGSVGFQQTTIPDGNGKPIAIAIWYPSHAQPSPRPLDLFIQNVAVNGRVGGAKLPLILISHGAYGSLSSHYDTAIALARAGFVVVALTHTGDNSTDQSYLGNRLDLITRPRQAKVALDWVLSSWGNRSSLDPDRVGMFGFSLGGFTTLVEIGGVPDLKRMALLCSTRPLAPECTFIKQRHGNQLQPAPTAPVWTHGPCIRAAVVAAPAVAYLFGPGSLRNVTISVQLWRAQDDSQAPDAWNSAMVRKELPRPPEEHVIPGQDHYIFLAPCSSALASAVPGICHDAPGFDRAAFHQTFNRAVVGFFSQKLKSR